MTDTDPTPRLLRRPEVRARTGLSDTRIDELEARGLFPKRVPISARAIGWVEAEITEHIRARIAARDGAPDPALRAAALAARRGWRVWRDDRGVHVTRAGDATAEVLQFGDWNEAANYLGALATPAA